jgi:hypothetical protein
VWLHIVAFGLSACLLLVGIGSQFVPWMKVVSVGRKRVHATQHRWLVWLAQWEPWLLRTWKTYACKGG